MALSDHMVDSTFTVTKDDGSGYACFRMDDGSGDTPMAVLITTAELVTLASRILDVVSERMDNASCL